MTKKVKIGDCKLALGDCREVLPILPDNSIDAEKLQRKINTLPLNKHMARMTKADEILKPISFDVRIERVERLDVVNVGCSPTRPVTTAAGITVSHSSTPSRPTPRRPVVFTMTATPRRIIRPRPVCVATLERTERHAALPTSAVVGIVKLTTTVQACQRMKLSLTLRLLGRSQHRGLAFGRVDTGTANQPTGQPQTVTRIMTCPGTVNSLMFRLDSRRTAAERLSTSRTLQSNLPRHSGSAGGVRTHPRTSRLSPILKPPEVG